MADVPSSLNSWSATASSNSPTDATNIGGGLADNLQALQAVVRGDLATKGSDIASSASPDVAAVQGLYHDITGSATIVGLGSSATAGIWKILQTDSTPIFKHNTALAMPASADYTAQAGDVLSFLCEDSNQWRCLNILNSVSAQRTAGASVVGMVKLANQTEYDAGTSGLVPTADLSRFSSTVIATTSGTAHTISGNVSGAKKITLSFSGVSTNGTSNTIVQIGDSSAVATAGYAGSMSWFHTSAAIVGAVFTTGFPADAVAGASGASKHGHVTLTLVDSSTNNWAASCVMADSADERNGIGGGSLALDSALTRIVITMVNGTDAFDAGTIGALIER